MVSPESPSSDREQHFNEVLAEYLEALETGRPDDRTTLFACHPELADELSAFFARQDQVQELTSPLRNVATVHDACVGRGRGGDTAFPALPPERFRIVREVGRGGMGVVYEAVELSLGRRVALKVLRREDQADPRALQRFLREARIVARLHHTNIVPIFRVGEHEGLHYFAMEFIDGGGLDKVLQEQRQTPRADTFARDVARIGVQVAEALAHAHEHGVLHRDIKPSNLLLDRQERVWVTDFGLAKEEHTDLTDPGEVVGTLRYLAPERFSGAVDARADVYGLGATLYELLTLRPLYDESDRAKLLAYILHDEPVRPRLIDGRIPRDLETIVLTALAKDPARRYASARALADDLRRFLDDAPIEARRISLLERGWRWCRRNPALAALTIAVFVVLAMGTAISTWQAIRATTAEEHAEKGWASEKIERERAVQEERVAKRRLFDARLAEARAGSKSGGVGQRVDSLNAVREAVALAKELALDEPAWADLRREAIACLGLTDLQLVKEWQGFELADTIFDPELRHYAQSDLRGIVTVHAVGEVGTRARMGDPGRTSTGVFSPGGDLLALTSQTFTVWDWQRQSLVWRCPHKDFIFSALAFHPNNRQIAVGRAGGTVAIVDLHSKEEAQHINLEAAPYRLAFSPDGKKLAAACYKSNQVQIRDVETGQMLCQWEEPAGPWGIAWHPDGALVAVWSNDFHIRLYNARTGVEQAILRGHQHAVVQAGFLPSGDRLWSWSWDGTTRLWDTWSGQELVRAFGINAQLSRDGHTLAARRGKQLFLWDLLGGEEYRTLPGWEIVNPLDAQHNQGGHLNPEGRVLAVGGTKGVRLLDLVSGSQTVLPTTGGACFHPSGRELFTFPPHNVYRWPLHLEQNTLRVGPPHALGQRAKAVAFDQNGARMILGRMTPSATVIDLDKPESAPRQLKHLGAMHVALSPDGRWAATGNHNGVGAKVWDAASGQLLRDLLTDRDNTIVRFRPDGRQLVTASFKQIILWETGSWTEQRRIPLSGEAQPAVAWDQRGKLLAYTSSRYQVELQDPATGRPLAALEAPDGLQVIAMLFTPGGDRLVVWSTSPSHIRVWDLRLLRQRLAQLGLDWEAPPYEPPAANPALPLRIEVDAGAAQNSAPVR